MAADSKSQVTYQRFLEFESLMKKYPSSGGQPYNAAPIGFCAFALTLFVYSMNMAGATVPVNTSPSMAMGLALFYGGLIQFLAGLFELRIGNNYHALLFCSYAGYWFGLGALYANTFSFYSLVTDVTVQYKALMLTYILFTASYFLLWDQGTTRAGGAIGIFTSVILWYIGFASLMKKGDNSYFDLPVFVLAPTDEVKPSP
ncbi:unnamed protein product [Rotaria socialis]|uniref:Uncharacterized protein n=1 Tax=Rotaria socialis TaxID=392032 RepID=A0A818FBT0_9BILA|nr:unnamed protein product [Rotaria socialis]